MLTDLATKRQMPLTLRQAFRLVMVVLFTAGLAACATEPPPPVECSVGYAPISPTNCAPLPKVRPKDVDNRPIPYDPKKIDNSPIKLPDGQKVPFEKRVPPSSAMTGEKSTNPFAKTGAQAAPTSSD